MSTILRVNSSSSNEVYNVTFTISNNNISIRCNCKAGASKLICKHRLDLIDGNISHLDLNDLQAYNEIISNLNKEKINTLLTSTNVLDSQIKELENERKKLKREIGVKLFDGF